MLKAFFSNLNFLLFFLIFCCIFVDMHISGNPDNLDKYDKENCMGAWNDWSACQPLEGHSTHRDSEDIWRIPVLDVYSTTAGNDISNINANDLCFKSRTYRILENDMKKRQERSKNCPYKHGIQEFILCGDCHDIPAVEKTELANLSYNNSKYYYNRFATILSICLSSFFILGTLIVLYFIFKGLKEKYLQKNKRIVCVYSNADNSDITNIGCEGQNMYGNDNNSSVEGLNSENKTCILLCENESKIDTNNNTKNRDGSSRSINSFKIPFFFRKKNGDKIFKNSEKEDVTNSKLDLNEDNKDDLKSLIVEANVYGKTGKCCKDMYFQKNKRAKNTENRSPTICSEITDVHYAHESFSLDETYDSLDKIIDKNVYLYNDLNGYNDTNGSTSNNNDIRQDFRQNKCIF